MLLSYCYIFSHPSSPALEPTSSTRHSRDAEPSPRSAVHSAAENTVLTSISNWSQDVGSSLRSAVPSSLTTLLSTASTEAARFADSSSKLVHSSLSSSGVTSWFVSPASEPKAIPASPSQAPIRPTQSNSQQVQDPASPRPARTTTFTFCLFGAVSTAAAYLLIRNRRTMNRLHSAKSLAYRDARAWRKVALDFARINALSANRVQNLVAASLRDGKAGSDIGRQIERELEEATRVVAQRRNWIKEQDRKDADSSSSAGSERSFVDAWGDFLDPHHTGFFFGSRAGRRGSDLGEYGRWKPRHFSRHDDVSEFSSDGLAFKASQPWSRCTSENVQEGASPARRSAQLKWQRVAGHSATAAPFDASPSTASQSPTSTSSARNPSEAEAESFAREEWIGDVDRAIRERDLRSSQTKNESDQAALKAFSRLESEPSVDSGDRFSLRSEAERESVDEEGDYLLPVSDLYIATNGQMRDAPQESIEQITVAPKTKKAKLGAAQIKTSVTGGDDTYSYPISDQFRDLQDIFIAAWDGNFTGLTNPATLLDDSSKPDQPAEIAKAKPNRALFERLRSDKDSKITDKAEAAPAPVDEIDFMAELMFPSAAAQDQAASRKPSADQAASIISSNAKEEELTKKLEQKQAELAAYKAKVEALSERLDSMRDMCHELTDEASRREKTHKIQVEQLDHKIGLFTVWAEEVQRRLGLETPPFFASLRKPLKRDYTVAYV